MKHCNLVGCMNEAKYEHQQVFKKKWLVWIYFCDDHVKEFEKLQK